jgi:4a-hydroxytetrahydrobiopterin dehydratase
MPELLSQHEVDSALQTDLPAWTQEGSSLTRTVTASSFPGGIDLVRRVAEAAEEMNHHPDIDIRWTKITFRLSTHSAGGLTTADLTLARKIDAAAAGA